MNKGRKVTGGKYHAIRKSKLYEYTRQDREVTLGDTKIKNLKVVGGNYKAVLFKTNLANVLSGKKVVKTEIKNVIETPQNKFFARDNRLLKGAIIETGLGKAKITNRPSQEGCVNAVLIEAK